MGLDVISESNDFLWVLLQFVSPVVSSSGIEEERSCADVHRHKTCLSLAGFANIVFFGIRKDSVML